MAEDHERTASLMTPAKLAQMAQMKPKPAASAEAWLDQMAADAGHSHVRRLIELRDQLLTQASAGEAASLAASVHRFAAVLPQLDFTLLEPKGWLARATGKAKTAGVEFAGQFDRIVQSASALKDDAQSFAKKLQPQLQTTDRALVEFEVEWRAIEKIQDQGARWLQDMRAQLKARQAANPDEEAQKKIREDASRCEVLLDRLKKLRAVNASAQVAHQMGQATSGRQGALLQAAQQLVTSQLKSWEQRLAPVASAASDGGTAPLLDDAQSAHRELDQRLKQVMADCEQVDVQQRAFVDQLASLGQHLQGAC